MWFSTLAICVTLVASFQIPFVNPEDQNVRTHFTLVDSELLPIDLKPYINNVVVRAEKSPSLKSFLRDHKHVVWSHNSIQNTIDFQVDSDHLKHFTESYSMVISDLPQKIFETYPQGLTCNNFEAKQASFIDELKAAVDGRVNSKEKLQIMSELFFKQYRTLDSITAWLELLESTYSDILSLETIGETYEGRPFQILHLSVMSNIPHNDKKTIVVTGGVHAREWISVSSVLFSIYDILNRYESDPSSWKEFANLDFIFIPVLNPDGYEYSWLSDRLWRKNRQPPAEDEGSECRGIDIDHSFDFHWTKSSDSACGEEYAGNVPFEAFESRIWDSYLNETNERHKIWGYIDLHSYAQEILYPYAFSCSQQPRDEENLIELAYGISKAIRMTSGKSYNVLPACVDRDSDLIPDMGSGSALDYMYHHKSYWAYQFKLRDSGSHGFLLPDKYIMPVGEEIAAGLKVFCRFILSDD